MPEPERSIEDLVEGVWDEGYAAGVVDEGGERRRDGVVIEPSDTARDTLLRAVARLREERDGLAVTAATLLLERGQNELSDPRFAASGLTLTDLAKVYWQRDSTFAAPPALARALTVAEANEVLRQYALTPKGGKP